jgi:hypothetical protein
MKNAVFWDVAPCRSCEMNLRFGGIYRLHLQGRKIRERGTSMSRWLLSVYLLPAHAGSSLADFSTPKVEAIRSSETSVHTRSKRRHISEDGILLFLFFFPVLFRDIFSIEIVQRRCSDERWMLNWKGSGRKRSWINRSTIQAFSWRCWRKPTRELSRYIRCLGRDPNWTPPEYVSRPLPVGYCVR